jgi:hypothetical protein
MGFCSDLGPRIRIPINTTECRHDRRPLREHDDARSVFLQSAASSIFAQLRSAIAGHQSGKPIEVHELDDKTAGKVPKKMIGRTLTVAEAKKLLARL